MTKLFYLFITFIITNQVFAEISIDSNKYISPEKYQLILDDEATPSTITKISNYSDLDYFEIKRISVAIRDTIDTNAQQGIITSFDPRPTGKTPAPSKGWTWQPLRTVTSCKLTFEGWTCPIAGHYLSFESISSLGNISYIDETIATLTNILGNEIDNLPEYFNSLFKSLLDADGGAVSIRQLGYFRATANFWTFEDTSRVFDPNQIIVCHKGRTTQVLERKFILHIEHGDTVGECTIDNRPTRAIGVDCNRDWITMVETCKLSNEMPGLEIIKIYGIISTIEITHWEEPVEHCYKSGCYISDFGISLNGGEPLYMRHGHEDSRIWINSGTGNGNGGALFWVNNSLLPLTNGTYIYNLPYKIY